MSAFSEVGAIGLRRSFSFSEYYNSIGLSEAAFVEIDEQSVIPRDATFIGWAFLNKDGTVKKVYRDRNIKDADLKFEHFKIVGFDGPFEDTSVEGFAVRKAWSLTKNPKQIFMPKVFDDFANNFDLTDHFDGLDEALSEIQYIYLHGDDEFAELTDYMRMHGDEEFYADCVQALIYGYEVIEDDK